MKAKSQALQTFPARKISLAALALALAISLWMIVAAPQAQAATVRLDGMRTTLTTDPGTTTALFSAGIITLPVWPTPVAPTSDAAKYTFPITGGAVNAKTLAGSIRHSGGLLLAQRTNTNGWKSLGLTRFTINITGSPNLTAKVNGGSRAEIATLDLGSAKITKFMKHHRAYVHIANVGVTLNATATGAINATFGTSLPSTVKLGTADVLARVAR
jgi:hypothetical protein